MLLPLVTATVQGAWHWVRATHAGRVGTRRVVDSSLGVDDAPLRRARGDAAEVRALADAHARRDPGFASDLRAAADRYEALVIEPMLLERSIRGQEGVEPMLHAQSIRG
jgi:alkylhydroperoxidase family enzyme